jgi:DnaJ-class molecular chaperone
MRKQVKGKGMPFYKDSMSNGFLYIDFDIEFPKKGEIKQIDDLKKVT